VNKAVLLIQVSDESTSCEGLARVAAMLDDVIYRDQQVPLSRDTGGSLLNSLLPGRRGAPTLPLTDANGVDIAPY